MKEVVYAALAGLALALAFMAGSYYRHPTPSSQVAQTAEAPKHDELHDLQVQKLCADGAAAFFKQERGSPNGNHVLTYESHYNIKFHKCLIHTNEWNLEKVITENYSTDVDEINDAFEGTDYGTCLTRFDAETKKESLGICWKHNLKGSNEPVHSKSDWQAYADGLMKG